jgi:murein DD-endopeptidase MepM/ murein hydrolase activator NlpD
MVKFIMLYLEVRSMKQSLKKLIILLLTISGLLIGSLVAGAEERAVTFLRTTIQPGFFIQVRIKAAPRAKVTIKFLDQTKELYPETRSGFLGVETVLRSVLKPVRWLCRVKTRVDFKGLIATSYATQPGKYLCKVEIKDGESVLLQEQPIVVINRFFAEERIKVTETTRQDTLSPEKRAADEYLNQIIIAQAVRQKVRPLWKGRFAWPLQGRITAAYGLIRYVNDLENGRHAGWDLADPMGTPVRAINRGRVVFAGRMYATGNTVIIHHGLDLFSLYAHLSKIYVRAGKMVRKRGCLGAVGSTGLSTGPHLHLTLKVGNISVNPLLVVGQKIEWAK